MKAFVDKIHASEELEEAINFIIGNSETRSKQTDVRNSAYTLLPGTLTNISEEDDDDIFDYVKNKQLSDGGSIADLLLTRQNHRRITDGINLTLELVGLIRTRFIGETFEQYFYFKCMLDDLNLFTDLILDITL